VKSRFRTLVVAFATFATFATLASTAIVTAQTLPELFGRAKEQIKAGSWADAAKTLESLEAEAAKPGNEAAQKQLAGPLAFYRGVCNANLGKTDDAVTSFTAFLKLQPNATIDSAVYSKKAVAAFEKAQKLAAERAPSLAESYKEFQPPADLANRYPADQYWGDGPAHWIMTGAEKTAWAALTEPNARVAFVEEFWKSRSSLPGLDGRTYRQEFDRRVAFADANLAVDPEQRGSLTDRGMVFILLGPPSFAGRKPLRTGDDSFDNAGLSRNGSQDQVNAERGAKASAYSNYGRLPSSGQMAQTSIGYVGPGLKAASATQDGLEVWHYRKELLPRAVPYLQVDFEFVTKKGYGVNVLQRSEETSNTLGAAPPVPVAPTN
jgi:GWxTD domain-containing protein